MTDIICNWLNNEVKLSKTIDERNFASELSSGFLIGELLEKFKLINDFDQFSQSATEDSKLNNFMRLEPVMSLLEVPFDIKTARKIMTEQPGIATKLMYELFIALNKKEKNKLTGVAMETMRPAAPVKLEKVESTMYKNKLKQITPRQTDNNLQSISNKYIDARIEKEKTNFQAAYEEKLEHEKWIQQKRQEELDLQKNRIEKRTEMLAKIQAAIVKIPKPPPSQTVKAIQYRKNVRKLQEAESMRNDIDTFEAKKVRQLPQSMDDEDIMEGDHGGLAMGTHVEGVEMIKPRSNDAYINKIKKKLNEDHLAREEREKRRRKILVDQMKAHEAQEDARREEQLVNRLLRQSQQERRIATQMLQSRKEKDVIRQNRISREEQYAETRAKEFQEALEREAEMARLAKLEYEDEARKEKELHQQLMEEKRAAQYQRHYDKCMIDVLDMVDLATKTAEYRELTQKLIPPKVMRDWCTLFTSGLPLYEKVLPPNMSDEPTVEELLEIERQNLLDEADFGEYRTFSGEWNPPEGSEIDGPPRNNPILGHIIQRLFDLVHPPSPPPEAPVLPDFPIRLSLLGKPFAGKSTILKMVSETRKVQILQVDSLIEEYITAFKNKEVTELPPVIEEVKEKQDTEDQEKNAENQSEAEVPQPPPVIKKEKTKKGKSRTVGPKPTLRAELGGRALNLLKKGKPIDDELLVEIFVESINRLENGTGWVLDGFPNNFNQAKLLEKALTGEDPTIDKKGKKKKSELAPDPRPAPPPPEKKSFLDVVVYFDLSDDLCMKRSIGRTKQLQNESVEYHPEFKPPPEGSSTGVKGEEMLVKVTDFSYDKEQLQTRLTNFQENWPKLEKFYKKYGRLESIDCSLPATSVGLELEDVMDDTLDRILKRGAYEELPPPPEPEPEPVKEPVEEPKPEVPAEPEKPATPVTPPGSGKKKGKRSASQSPSSSKRGRSPGKKDKEDSGKKSRESSGGKKSKSPKGGKRKKSKSEPEPEPPAVESLLPPASPPIQPGSDEWTWVDQPLPEELSVAISGQWEAIEETYMKNDKAVFRKIREERENVIRYLYDIRQEFLCYLRRPDQKQDRIRIWQKEFNSIPDDLRDDEEQRSELHERVDDLQDTLWQMSDDRKAAAEKEIDTIVKDGWLDDRVGFLINHYLSLMQVEADRYQDTMRLLKDYYRAMEGKIPDEANRGFFRMPLVELETQSEAQSVSRPATPASQGNTGDGTKSEGAGTPSNVTSPSRQGSAKSGGRRSTSPKARKGSGKKRSISKIEKEEVLTQQLMDPESKTVSIPLIPRRPTSPDGQGKGKGGTAKKKEAQTEDAPTPPEDLDERLLFDGLQNCIQTIDRILAAEIAAKEAEEQAERESELQKEREQAAEKEKASKGNKKDKKDKKGKASPRNRSRTPSGKKGKKEKVEEIPVANTPAPEISEEEKAAKKLKEDMKLEYFAALQNEAESVKRRVNLIRYVALATMADLRSKADVAYKDMDDWLGSRFLKEMDSVKYLTTVMKHAIESGTKIKEELEIDQDQFVISEIPLKDLEDNMKVDPRFYVNSDTKVIRTPTPPPLPEVKEALHPDTFTVEQLLNVFRQFSQTAPDGLMSVQSFVDTFSSLISLSHGTEQLPDMWLQATNHQVESLALNLSADGEYVDWHLLMLHIAQPWPMPTQSQLLQTLNAFKQMDQLSTNFVTREQYDAIQLWFLTDEEKARMNKEEKKETVEIEEELIEPIAESFDRLGHLKSAFFEIFADQRQRQPNLNYIDMLLYFSLSHDSNDGFLRALSVTSGKHMPRLPGKMPIHIPINPTEDKGPQMIAGTSRHATLMAKETFFEPPTDIPDDAIEAAVNMNDLYKVLHHAQNERGDSHRFSVMTNPEQVFSKDRLAGVWHELGYSEEEAISLILLIEHPIISEMISICNTYTFVDLKTIIPPQFLETADITSIKTGD